MKSKILIAIIILINIFVIQKNDIIFWTIELTPTYRVVINDIVNNFNDSQDEFDVKWLDIPFNSYEQKYDMVKGTSLEPDIINVNTNILISLYNQNQLNIIDKNDIRNFYENQILSCTINNELFQVPWYLSPQITIINKDIFFKQNIGEYKDLIMNWKTVEDISYKIKNNTSYISIIPNIIGFDILYLDGVKFLDEKNHSIFNKDKNALYTLNILRNMYRDQVLTNLDGYQRALTYYKQGMLQIYPVGTSFLKFQQEDEKLKSITDIISPILSLNNTIKSSPMSLSITKKQNYEKSIKFIEYLTTDEIQYEFMTKQTILPPNKNELIYDYYNSDKNIINIGMINQYNNISNSIDININHNIPFEIYTQYQRIINNYYSDQIKGIYEPQVALNLQQEECDYLIYQYENGELK